MIKYVKMDVAFYCAKTVNKTSNVNNEAFRRVAKPHLRPKLNVVSFTLLLLCQVQGKITQIVHSYFKVNALKTDK